MMLFSPQMQPDLGEPYLRLQLDPTTQVVLPMKYAQQVLTIPYHKLTSMPNMPPHVIGLVSQRNRIYWLIDLCLLLGLNFNSKNVREYNVTLINIDKFALALAVQKIKGVTRITEQQIQYSLESVKEEILPYVSGYIVEKENIIYILNPLSIINKK